MPPSSKHRSLAEVRTATIEAKSVVRRRRTKQNKKKKGGNVVERAEEEPGMLTVKE